MKTGQIVNRIKVGVFVAIAIVLVTSLIFYIGSNHQKFGSKREVYTIFKDVAGLKKGNIVRYAGVAIGTVEAIDIIGDSSVRVTLLVDIEAGKFIKKDSKASISTEGLLGSKYVKISYGSPDAGSIESGDMLTAVEPVDVDKFMTMLNETGMNAKSITANLDSITSGIKNGKGSLGALIANDDVINQVGDILTSFERSGTNTTQLTGKMMRVVDTLQEASSNTIVITENMKQAGESSVFIMEDLKTAGENSVVVSKNLKHFSEKLNNDSSALGRILADTSMGEQLMETLQTLKTTAEDVQETSAKVRSSFLVRIFNKNKKKKDK